MSILIKLINEHLIRLYLCLTSLSLSLKSNLFVSSGACLCPQRFSPIKSNLQTTNRSSGKVHCQCTGRTVSLPPIRIDPGLISLLMPILPYSLLFPLSLILYPLLFLLFSLDRYRFYPAILKTIITTSLYPCPPD